MASNKVLIARLKAMEAKLDKAMRRMSRIENLLSDASQKLCHLIKRQRDCLRQSTATSDED